MIYTTKELLELGKTEYSIRNKLADGSLYLIERWYYNTNLEYNYNNEVFISKKYPSAILTGLSAFFIFGLTDYIPDYFYLATEQHSFPLSKQSYQDASFFEVEAI